MFGEQAPANPLRRIDEGIKISRVEISAALVIEFFAEGNCEFMDLETESREGRR